MPSTPFFPAWRCHLAPMRTSTAQALRRVRAHTLARLETSFAPWLPNDLFPKTPTGPNSRDRHYTARRTFWCALWRAFNPQAPGREVVRQLQALFALENGPALSGQDGACCRAKARLPVCEWKRAWVATAQTAQRKAPVPTLLQGRVVKVVDGSALTLPDTPQHRVAYPPFQCPDKPCFPMMRVVVLFSLACGAITARAQGNLGDSELALWRTLQPPLNRGDILIGDRGFGCYPLIAWLLRALGVDFIGRTPRHLDGRRRCQRLAHNDWLIRWKQGAQASAWLEADVWAQLPTQITLRVVKGRCYQKGFRVRQVTVVTTLLDAQRYPAQDILPAYRRRWRLEMCLDDLKTTLHMDLLRSRSPVMAEKEVYSRLIAHNLIRALLAETAATQEVPMERLSFKGALDALRHFSVAMSRVRRQHKRQRLWQHPLETLAADQVPERPGRREPRAVKRRKTKYARLNVPRHQFRDPLKRHVRRTLARLRKLGLM